MGCIQIKKSYFNLDNVQERDIRRWEKEIGSYIIDFKEINQKLCFSSKSIPYSILERVIKSDFSDELMKVFISSESYMITDTDTNTDTNSNKTDNLNKTPLFNNEKIINTCFLLSSPCSLSSNSLFYNDKSYFLYSNIKSLDEDSMEDAIFKNEILLKKVIFDLVTATISLTEAYFKLKSLSDKGIINEVNKHVNEICEYIINDMFKVRDGNCQTLSYKDVKDKFVEDMFFFSSGYFRVKALECIELINKAENVKEEGKEERKK